MRTRSLIVGLFLPFVLDANALLAQENPAQFSVPAELSFRRDFILSEGTRMAAEVFSRKDARDNDSDDNKKLPTIVMSHGWGGTAEALRPDAIVFAKAGYLVVAFDYRGWGQSDSRLLPVTKPEQKDGKLIAEVKDSGRSSIRSTRRPTFSTR